MNSDATPTLLHPETIPFLYESFDTALVECFPNLGEDMLNVYGAVLSGSKANVRSTKILTIFYFLRIKCFKQIIIILKALRAISPATTKMLLKTVRDSSTSQEVHIAAIYCSAKSIQVILSSYPTFTWLKKYISVFFRQFMKPQFMNVS